MKSVITLLFCLLSALSASTQDIIPAPAGQFSCTTVKYTRPAIPRVPENELDLWFSSQEIPDSVFSLMQGKSWKKNCSLSRSDLRYLRLLHNDADGRTRTGEMIVNKIIADKVLKIFKELYLAGYRIERIELVDNYNADDTASIDANNTSAFNFRRVAGKAKLSLHARGLAIDLNPLYNPYISYRTSGGKRVPKTLRTRWAFNRDTRTDIPYKIDSADLATRLFLREGFQWGGNWRNSKDYQHFEFRPRH